MTNNLITINTSIGKKLQTCLKKRHASLNNAISSNAMKIDRSIVLSANNVEVDNGIIYLPLYMASLI